jgi:hypothetical protein
MALRSQGARRAKPDFVAHVGHTTAACGKLFWRQFSFEIGWLGPPILCVLAFSKFGEREEKA